MDHVIIESCYKGTILQRIYRKMTISWSFSHESFVKFHGKKKIGSYMTMLYPNACYNKVCYIGTALYLVWTFYRMCTGKEGSGETA